MSGVMGMGSIAMGIIVHPGRRHCGRRRSNQRSVRAVDMAASQGHRTVRRPPWSINRMGWGWRGGGPWSLPGHSRNQLAQSVRIGRRAVRRGGSPPFKNAVDASLGPPKSRALGAGRSAGRSSTDPMRLIWCMGFTSGGGGGACGVRAEEPISDPSRWPGRWIRSTTERYLHVER